MATEIERKFLVDHSLWTPTGEGVPIRQGYLSTVNERVVRVRTAGSKGFLTIKGRSESFSRLEFEYPIPYDDASVLLDRLCEQPLVEKIRYHEKLAGHVWEIDVFHGANKGLIVAEIELESEAESFDRPAWIVGEVTDDPRYFNNNLAREPYKSWERETK